jgi:hypothetical protein
LGGLKINFYKCLFRILNRQTVLAASLFLDVFQSKSFENNS